MPGLTVTEKEHWKNRIGKRIDKKVDTLVAIDPGLFERINREANQKALESLGIAEFKRELDAIEKQEAAMERRKKRLQREMSAKVRGVQIEEIEDDFYCCGRNPEVDSAVNKRQSLHEDDLLAQNELGQQILRLRTERDNLLDTVWLATSSKQIRDLWTKVAELLGEQPTQLERDALAIPPMTDE